MEIRNGIIDSIVLSDFGSGKAYTIDLVRKSYTHDLSRNDFPFMRDGVLEEIEARAIFHIKKKIADEIIDKITVVKRMDPYYSSVKFEATVNVIDFLHNIEMLKKRNNKLHSIISSMKKDQLNLSWLVKRFFFLLWNKIKNKVHDVQK